MPEKSRFVAIWTPALALAAAAMAVHPEHEADAFWHLSLGRAVIAHRSRVIPEPLALPAFSAPAVVPEWLWGVVTYAIDRAGSWPALVVFVALLAAAAAALSVRLAAAFAPRIGGFGLSLVTGIAVGAAMGRVRLRPEAAGVVLIPAFLLIALRYAEADEKRRLRLGMALAGVEILWAQIHGSFVLAPALFAAVAGPAVLRDRRDASRRQAHVVTAAALALGLCTSAYGLDLPRYLAAHARGDAARHVEDLVAPTWAAFNPSEVLSNPYGVLLAALWGVGVAGMMHARRVSGRSAALAALGAALAMNAVRFLPIGALLALPLSAEGAEALGDRVPARAAPLGAAIGAVGMILGALGIAEIHGPFGLIGPAEGVHPYAAAIYLGRRPGTSILSVYNAGGRLGFMLEGRGRVYVDGRTPLYFDDADFALSRDVFRYPDALARAIRRFGAQAVVVNRNAPVCGKLPPGWVPVVVEPHFTTFVSFPGEKGLDRVSPCGPAFLRADACERDGAALDEEIARLAGYGDRVFTDYLRAERILRCGGDLGAIGGLIPPRSLARTYLAQRDALEAAWRVRIGDVARAADVVERAVRGGDPGAVAILAPAIAGDAVPADRARAVLEAAIDRLDDTAPPDLRALLALACAAEGDAACARFHAIRAAARGARQAAPALLWLRDHGDAKARADAAAWIEVLAAEAKGGEGEKAPAQR